MNSDSHWPRLYLYVAVPLFRDDTHDLVASTIQQILNIHTKQQFEIVIPKENIHRDGSGSDGGNRNVNNNNYIKN